MGTTLVFFSIKKPSLGFVECEVSNFPARYVAERDLIQLHPCFMETTATACVYEKIWLSGGNGWLRVTCSVEEEVLLNMIQRATSKKTPATRLEVPFTYVLPSVIWKQTKEY